MSEKTESPTFEKIKEISGLLLTRKEKAVLGLLCKRIDFLEEEVAQHRKALLRQDHATGYSRKTS